MRSVLLRFDAPLMSFGSVLVDQYNRTDLFPYRAMLVGLLANALGLTRDEVDAHESLQRRLRYAARCDRAGTLLDDYQTVDFDPTGPMGSRLGWTTEGILEERKGGTASEGTHIRYRQYVADAVLTVAFALTSESAAEIDLDEVIAALARPVRPLFLGRKCCIPSAPIYLGTVDTPSLRAALENCERIGARGDDGQLAAIWQQTDEDDDPLAVWPRVEDRDWANEIHIGRRIYIRGNVNPPEASAEAS
jgi:CRISPR system Cascade subunit CasD